MKMLGNKQAKWSKAVLAGVLAVGIWPIAGAPQMAKASVPTPGGIDSSKLALWVKADDGVQADAGAMTWTDWAGQNTFTADATTPYVNPSLVPAAINFNPAVQFGGYSYFAGDASIAMKEAYAVAMWDGNTDGPNSQSTKGTVLSTLTRAIPGEGSALYYFWNDATKIYSGTGSYSKVNAPADGTYNLWNAASGVYRQNGGSLTAAADTFNIVGTPQIGKRNEFVDDANMGNMNGSIAEVIALNAKADSTERQKVDSYLAVKYGITLNGGASDYLDTSGQHVWTADAVYKNNIAGIGRDDAEGLNQKQSRSIQASDPQVAIGLDVLAGTNDANTGTLADKQYLVWGDNGQGLTLTESIGTSFRKRTARVWKVQNTGSVGQVQIAMPKSALPANTSLLVSDSADFTGASTVEYPLTEISLGGVPHLAANTTLANGQFFTFVGPVPTAVNKETGAAYTDVSTALNEALDGQTVLLLADAAPAGNILYNRLGVGVTLDLNGHNIVRTASGGGETGADSTVYVQAGTLTIQDTSAEANGRIELVNPGVKGSGVNIDAAGTVNLLSGGIIGSGQGVYAHTAGAHFNMSGGLLYGSAPTGGGSEALDAINGAYITISGGYLGVKDSTSKMIWSSSALSTTYWSITGGYFTSNMVNTQTLQAFVTQGVVTALDPPLTHPLTGDTQYKYHLTVPRTIAFNANGGTVTTGSESAVTAADGKLAGSLPEAELSDAIFDGWYTAISGGTKITADYVFDRDTTVYAHYTDAASVTVSVTAPADHSTDHTGKPIFSGTATPGSAITVTDGSGHTYTAIVDSNGDWSVTPTADLPDGDYSFSVTAEKDGKTSSSVTRQVTVDTALPTMGGTVAITGTAKYDEVLTANISGITYNPDATGDVPTYQWYCGSDPIDGATGATYTLTEADIGQTISVKVSADGVHATGSVASAATGTVAKADGPAAPSAPEADSKTTTSITLKAVAGQEYSKDNGATWQDGVEFSDLAPNTDYVFVTRVKATATHEASPVSTAATIRTEAAALPTMGGTVSITGTAKYDEVLTADITGVTYNPDATDDVPTYQWYRGADPITDATGATYTLMEADIGQAISVKVSADGVHATGSVASAATGTVAKADGPAAPSAPEADGKTTTSITLKAVAGQEYSKDNGATWQDGVEFSGLTPDTNYTFVTRVKATATHEASPVSAAATIRTEAAVLPTMGGTVSITGTAKYDEVLTADITGVTYNPDATDDVPTYQWYRGADPITDATGATYTLMEADIGQTISVKVSADGVHATGSVASAATGTVAKADGPAAPSAPEADGKTTTSITLKVVDGQEYSKDNGATWQDGATFTGLTPNTDYVFVTRVKATTTHEASPASTAATIRTEAVVLPTMGGTVALTGTAKYGEELTADITGITYNPDATGDVPTYQWYRGGEPIMGATDATYTLTEADIGQAISVKVSADGVHATGSVTSAATGTVAKADGPAAPSAPEADGKTTTSITLKAVAGQEYSKDNGATWQDGATFTGLTPNTDYSFVTRVKATATHEASPVSTAATIRTEAAALPTMGGTVSITGTAKYGEELTADITDITYTPSASDDVPTYQWYRGADPIDGATAATYTLTEADIGQTISVKVSADGVHATGSVTSSATGTVAKADGPAAPSAPEADGKTTTSITLKVVDGQEYSKDNGATWQDGATFSGLTPNTDYTFVTRVKATATHEASPASTAATIRTQASSSGGVVVPPVVTPEPEPVRTDLESSVNNKDGGFATGTTSASGDRDVTAGQVDLDKLNQALAQGSGQKLAIRSAQDGDLKLEGLTADTLKQLADKGASLDIGNLLAIYPVPGGKMDLNDVSKRLSDASLGDIAVHIDIARSSDELINNAKSQAAAAGYELLVTPVDLDLTFSHDGQTVRSEQLNGYSVKYIALPDGIDPNRITTGVIVNPDGSVFHVPTVVTKIDNRYFAMINDLHSHGTYSVIWNPQDFDDVRGHWGQADVNNIAARLELAGTGNNTFSPNRNVTRSEFAQIVVSGLGLMRQNAPDSLFTDVPEAVWYKDAVTIANEFGIVLGYNDGTFAGNDQITREQGIAMVARAYELITQKGQLDPAKVQAILSQYTDGAKVSGWAQECVARMIDAGIVNGYQASELLAPKAKMTRAEVAALIARLLKTTELIDK